MRWRQRGRLEHPGYISVQGNIRIGVNPAQVRTQGIKPKSLTHGVERQGMQGKSDRTDQVENGL